MRKTLLLVSLMLLPFWAAIPLYSTTSSDVTGIPLSGGTGEIETGVFDSQLGIVDFPFSGDGGFYRIIITTSSGGSYHGSFHI